MSCGCNSNGDNQDSSGLESKSFMAQISPAYKDYQSPGSCESTKGKLYDILIEDFIVPEIGREAYIKVCDGTRWKKDQFIGVNLGASKIAAFKITEVGNKKIRVLNGCDKSGDNGILGNPEKGSTIKTGSVMYPVPPTGCESGLALQILNVIQTSGTDAIVELLANREDICFTSVKESAEDEEVHLFGGTRPDCDCAPEASISSCLRKIVKIFTGQGGKTLCMPEAASVVFSGDKRVAVFDENKCLKRGPTYADLLNCETDQQLDEDGQANSIMACSAGVRSGFEAWAKNLALTTVEVDDPDSDDPNDKIFVWKSVKKDYAVIQHKTSAGTGGGATVANTWTIKPLTDIVQQSTGFVSLSGNIITINRPGVYKISFSNNFYATNDSQSRIENADDANEVYYGLSVSPGYGSGFVETVTDSGFAVVEVATTKRLKLMYRTLIVRADGLGLPNAWGPNVYANVSIESL